ncbi:rna-directed dna polymerase from mobile element jockey-like [Pitangus sulphuratus]|nr:rna-directed dna polymerase from mobile element jockey-like [Pitangus sulphuratus]
MEEHQTGQQWVRGPVLINVLINYLDAGLEGILSKFADDTKLGGAVESLKVREALKRDLDKSEGWAITNHVKGKSRILYLGLSNPGCLYGLGNEMIESIVTERDPGLMVNGKLNLSQQRLASQEGQECPGGHQAEHHQLVKGSDCLTLLCTGVASL